MLIDYEGLDRELGHNHREFPLGNPDSDYLHMKIFKELLVNGHLLSSTFHVDQYFIQLVVVS